MGEIERQIQVNATQLSRLRNIPRASRVDHFAEAALGRANYRPIVRAGRNDVVSSAAIEDVWLVGGLMPWLASAVAFEVVSSDANDTSAGTGARQVVVEYLNSEYREVVETISMNGMTPVPLSENAIRINFAYVLGAGTFNSTSLLGSNLGNIDIRTVSGSTVHARISVGTSFGGFGETQMARYSVPLGFSALLTSYDIEVETSQPVDIVLWQNPRSADETTAPFGAQRVVTYVEGVVGTVTRRGGYPRGPFPERTDIWWSAKASSGNSSISVDFRVALVSIGTT